MFDVNSKFACVLDKNDGTTMFTYDLMDGLTRVVDRNGYATVYEYDANGNRTAVHYANGFTTTYDYDLLNRLICEKIVDINGDIVVQYIYTLGAAGERKSVTELGRAVEYTYDSLYRLTSETITEGERVTVYTYAYDNVSNRILKTENGSATEYVYNALNQLISDSNTSYEYDLNGNLVRVIGSAQSALYEYNAENKLIKATVQNGVLVTEESYTYDYQGNRTSKTTHRSDGVTEHVKYLNDNSSLTNVLAEIDENGTAKCVYTIGADLVSQERDGNVSVYLYDGHGSVVGLANESGIVTDTYAYDAFGNLLKSKGNTENCYRYCGEQFDETTGLYYLRARYMDTSTGRFISQDTYQGNINGPVSLHKYLYANANPVAYSDPSGCVSKTLTDSVETLIIITICPYIISYKSEEQRNKWASYEGGKILSALKAMEPYLPFASIWGNQIVTLLHQLDYGTKELVDFAAQLRDNMLDEALKNTNTQSDEIKNNLRTYFHATSFKSGLEIVLTNVLKGSKEEAGYYVFAWKKRPNKKVLALSGAKFAEVLVKFKTNASFENDWGINDSKIKMFEPVRSVFKGPIYLAESCLLPIHNK